MPAKAANFAVVAIAAIAASVQAYQCDLPKQEGRTDRLKLHQENYVFLNGCDGRKPNLRFALYNQMLPRLMGESYSYDVAVTDFINADLDGDGIVQKEEYVQR